MSSGRRAFAFASLALIGCSSPKILAIDQDLAAFDLENCARQQPPCVTTGKVSATTEMLPDGMHEVELDAPASIEAPLNEPTSPGRLAYVALGTNGLLDKTMLELSIVGDDSTKASIEIPQGLKQIEVDMREYAAQPGAHLRVACTAGGVQLTYVVGRWFVP